MKTARMPFFDALDLFAFIVLAFGSGVALQSYHFAGSVLFVVAMIWVSVLGYLLRPIKA